ncbi:protein bric-a-brac 2-like isoform X2 [Macrosteles quadrilineatus]|uniref:protein bric-a-brac 2-like isoform X2 n=1 Tax=Macrosteles quadrilineatus TaxID=74068 RepID=UPI0023E17026|nr:protein bric-a-brac 2-like isoform X2 [Macrosteles quadrilineatus]
MSDDQQFCLRWNNFQTNFTSQFKALRVDEDFVDVTLACEGKRIKAHKLVLSACSPYFKELFKGNPCKHPIIFMQDVEYEHLMNLVEFMYAGQVNICQTKLPNFLHTAESLQIRGLSAQSQNKLPQTSEDRSEELRPGPSLGDSPDMESRGSSPDQALDEEGEGETSLPSKRLRESTSYNDVPTTALIETKMEPMDYYSDGEIQPTTSHNSMLDHPVGASRGYTMQGTFDAAASISAQISQLHEASQEQMQVAWKRRQAMREFLAEASSSRASSSSRISLGFGVEVSLNQLRGVKWSDYRKLTRSLASILFSHQELATRSVTGQRWSRYLSAGDDRPVKPALDPSKIHAIIAYVRALFPHVAVSHIKQVLAYKCKECAAAVAHKYKPTSTNP